MLTKLLSINPFLRVYLMGETATLGGRSIHGPISQMKTLRRLLVQWAGRWGTRVQSDSRVISYNVTWLLLEKKENKQIGEWKGNSVTLLMHLFIYSRNMLPSIYQALF